MKRLKAWLSLLYAQNCAQATLLCVHRNVQRKESLLVKAATNFEGGVVGCGSTCGVVTGGVLGIGSLMGSRPGISNEEREKKIQWMSRCYVDWFKERFGTCLCRERVAVDFATARGILRYFIPGIKLVKCLHHIGEAVCFLDRMMRRELGAEDTPGGIKSGKTLEPEEPHCAFTVFKRIVDRDTEAYMSIAPAVTGLVGGAALSGGACGALLGSFLALGLEYGYDPGSMELFDITRAFIRGHGNLLKHDTFAGLQPVEIPGEAFARSRYLADAFLKRFGSLSCMEITEKQFSSVEEVRCFLDERRGCRDIQAWCQKETSRLLPTG